jgi:hypothetical protein
MNNRDRIKRVQDATGKGPGYGLALDAVWGFLEGQITRQEAEEQLAAAGVDSPGKLLREVGA